MMMNSLYGNFRHRKFTDVFPDYTEFKNEYDNCQLPNLSQLLTNDSVKTTYYLMYARYGNSVIASDDENQFKYRLFSIMWQYGPTWQRNIDIQKSLRELTEDEIVAGGKAIYNHAYNPGTLPTTQSLEELQYINDQNTTNYKKSKLEGYAILESLLANDVTEDFMERFKKLFMTIVEPEYPLWYKEDAND